MSPPHSVWKHFKKGRNNYKQNATHKEAWCQFCTDAEVSLIRTGELDAEQRSEDSQPARDEETIRESCEYTTIHAFNDRYAPILGTVFVSARSLCGKVDALLAHLSKHCPHVPSERKDWAKRVLQERRQEDVRDGCHIRRAGAFGCG